MQRRNKDIIIACEKSQEICITFRENGFNAFSFDLQECSGRFPEWHIVADNDMHIKDILYKKYWKLCIAHPPCTRLSNSVWWYIIKNNLYDEVYQAAKFFNMILNCPIKCVCVENPIQNKEAKKYIIKQNQIIQPYNFGEDASKATCLWLKNLPLLKNTEYFPPRIINGKKRWENQTDGGWNKLGPSVNRGEIRSKTYRGIAEAMVNQWSKLL